MTEPDEIKPDEHLLAALRHAELSRAEPSQALDHLIRAAAHQTHQSMSPADSRSLPRATTTSTSWRRTLVAWWAKPTLAPAFGLIAVAVLATTLWHREDVPSVQPTPTAGPITSTTVAPAPAAAEVQSKPAPTEVRSPPAPTEVRSPPAPAASTSKTATAVSAKKATTTERAAGAAATQAPSPQSDMAPASPSRAEDKAALPQARERLEVTSAAPHANLPRAEVARAMARRPTQWLALLEAAQASTSGDGDVWLVLASGTRRALSQADQTWLQQVDAQTRQPWQQVTEANIARADAPTAPSTEVAGGPWHFERRDGRPWGQLRWVREQLQWHDPAGTVWVLPMSFEARQALQATAPR